MELIIHAPSSNKPQLLVFPTFHFSKPALRSFLYLFCKISISFSFSKFRLSYYPHLLEGFNKLVTKVFGDDAIHTILADFEPFDAVENPAYYIHICQKK